MFRTPLKSRIHRVAVNQCELHHEGPRAIDEDLPDAAHIAENEQVPGHQPQLVFVDDHNRQTELRHKVPTQTV
jgi:aspartate 1-decarboxylase